MFKIPYNILIYKILLSIIYVLGNQNKANARMINYSYFDYVQVGTPSSSTLFLPLKLHVPHDINVLN